MKRSPATDVERGGPGTDSAKADELYVVVLGGSAGSLEALEAFFEDLPAATGAAFVLVTHRDPREKGMMPEIISHLTAMPVEAAADGAMLAANTVYVVPAAATLAIRKGCFRLRVRASRKRGDAPTSIDDTFCAVASDRRERAIGVLLSGMGTDGTNGLRAISERGGLAMVQAPPSAQFDAMPKSAIGTGIVDVVGSPAELASRAVAYLARGAKEGPKIGDVDRILSLLTKRTGHDFSNYKRTTLGRRIERRMSALGMGNITDYRAFLEGNPAEASRLFHDLLIGVTRFFREPEMFDALKQLALPQLLTGRPPEQAIRVWVAGCATGEEAYSLAIVLREAVEQRGSLRWPIQIYATDLDQRAIDRARRGLYPASIARDVSPDRLARYFVEEDEGYRIKKEIRETIVFATQNVISDPPFTRLDILSCRNLLIYLNADLQKKVFPLFFHAIKPGGVLVLGGAETPTDATAFLAISEKWKIFRRAAVPSLQARSVEFPVTPRFARVVERPGKTPLAALVEREILDRLSPLVLVVDANGVIAFASKRLRPFFDPRSGRGAANAFATAKGGLDGYLRLLVRKALRSKKATQKGVRLRINGRARIVDLTAFALTEKVGGHGLAMVAIAEVGDAPLGKGARDAATRQELVRLRGQLRAMMAEMDRSQEELQSTNEELQSTNEELQSANEELTTSKEEMQSMNEELLTLNAELSARNDELAVTNDDMRNLLNSSQIPTLFLDNDLRLKRFTVQASRIANLIPGDVGRPITDIKLNLDYETLERDVREVLDTLVFKEVQVAGSAAEYTMRIHPYRTMDNMIDGVVITFLDVTELRRVAVARAARINEQLMEDFVHVLPGVAWVEDKSSGRTLATSDAAARELGYPREVLANATREFWRALRPPRDRNASESFRMRLGNGTLARFTEEIRELAASNGSAACFVLHRLHPLPEDEKPKRNGSEKAQARDGGRRQTRAAKPRASS